MKKAHNLAAAVAEIFVLTAQTEENNLRIQRKNWYQMS